MAKRSAGIAVAASAVLGLTGCVGETGGTSCADWVWFGTPQDQFDDAALVPSVFSRNTSAGTERAEQHLPLIDGDSEQRPMPRALR